MPTQQGIKYLTKADAAHWFRRSERSLSRDIINAIKANDDDVLSHVRLRLEDGTIRPGPDVSIDEIIHLRDEGQNPTWELEVAWMEIRYGRRGDTRQSDSGVDNLEPLSDSDLANDDARTTPRELPADPQVRLAVLETVNAELEKRNHEKDAHIRRLQIELDRRAEERREENELQKQNNVLMQQVYDLLMKMQESSGTISVIPHSRPGRSLPSSTTVDRKHVDAVDVEATPAAPATPRRRQSAPSDRRGSRKKSTKRTRSASKTRKPAKRKANKPSKQLPRRLFPTLDRAVRNFFGG